MDALVKLYQLPSQDASKQNMRQQGIRVRRAMAHETTQICSWVEKNFTQGWADECRIAFHCSPISCLVAEKNSQLIGFACHEVTARNYFGPLGVIAEAQKKGVGEALLLESLYIMRTLGYGYAIIGGCDGSEDFYIKTVKASTIEGSTPGIYPEKLDH